MAWRLARSLDTLRDEIRARWPGTTVWTIGDQAHAASASDHNPNAAGVVCAADVLGDGGLNLAWLAERIRTGGHPAAKYVIYDRRIASRSQGWVWRTYTGSNPHTTHVHVSVGTGPDGRSTGPYDDTTPWLQEAAMTPKDVWSFNIPRAADIDEYSDDPSWRALSIIRSTQTWAYRATKETRAARAEIQAVLAAVSGQDVADQLAALGDQLGAVQARLEHAAAERAELLTLVRSVAAGEADAAAVVDEIARRLGE